jgi:trimeric autotransporter adhesin
MKKITLLFLVFCSYLSFGQVCTQTFTAEGSDMAPTVLTVNASDLNCYAGTLNSIKISDADLGFFCGEWYVFNLDIDGTVTSVCGEDLIDMDITDFTTLTITSADAPEDGLEDDIFIGVMIEVNYTALTIPNCDAALTTPADGATNANLSGYLEWSAATGGVAGYKLSVGTTSSGTEVLNAFDVGNMTEFNIEGILLENTQYFVKIVPYNTNGDATGCNEYSFTTGSALSGDFCSNVVDLTNEESPLIGTTVGSLNDNEISCDNDGEDFENESADLYYSITVPSGSTLTMSQTTNDYDSTIVAFYGDCMDRTVIACFDDPDETEVVWANETGSDKTVYWIQDGYGGDEGPFTLEWSVVDCQNPVATFSKNSLCSDSAEEFEVVANITSLGSATSLTISDDQGSAPQTVSATGQVTFGPFTNNTPVVITVENDQNSLCFVTSQVINQLACPPVNDNAAGAIELFLDLGTVCGTSAITMISNLATSGSPEVDPSCTDLYTPTTENGDLWYKVVAPSSEFTLNVPDDSIAGGIFTVGGALYSGIPGALTEVGECSNTWPKSYTGLVMGETYYIRVWDAYTDGFGTFSLCGHYLDCVMPVAEFNVVSDCANGEQFMIEVVVSSLGSATSLTITDSVGSDPQEAMAAGTFTFGPYGNDTPVEFTIENDQNASCILESDMLNQIACPPANDNCINAIALTVDAAFCDGSNTNGDNSGALDSGVEQAECFWEGNKDVWFSFEVPEGTGSVNISTDFFGGTLFDTQIAVYSGTCGSLVEMDCDNDSGEVEVPNEDGYLSYISDVNVSVGQTYYVRVSGYYNDNGESSIGSFCLEVSTEDVLSNDDIALRNLSVYPNPVKDLLTLSYAQNISDVVVYNLLGQQVKAKSVNANEVKIDMSGLSAGSYLVKVTSENQTKTLKILKQ